MQRQRFVATCDYSLRYRSRAIRRRAHVRDVARVNGMIQRSLPRFSQPRCHAAEFSIASGLASLLSFTFASSGNRSPPRNQPLNLGPQRFCLLRTPSLDAE